MKLTSHNGEQWMQFQFSLNFFKSLNEIYFKMSYLHLILKQCLASNVLKVPKEKKYSLWIWYMNIIFYSITLMLQLETIFNIHVTLKYYTAQCISVEWCFKVEKL